MPWNSHEFRYGQAAAWLCLLLAIGLIAPIGARGQQPAPPPAGALQNFESGMEGLARSINKRLIDLNNSDASERRELSIAPFLGPDGANFPRLFEMLKRHLESKEMNCKVVPGASWKVTGEYSIGDRTAEGQLPITIMCQIRDRKNNPQSQLIKHIFTDGTAGVNALLGLSNSLPVERPKSSLDKTLEKIRQEIQDGSFLNPKGTLVVDGSKVKTAADSKFGLEIVLIKSVPAPDGSPVPLKNADGSPQLEGFPLPLRIDTSTGFAFVDIPADRLYAVRLINKSALDIGVALSIDGINSFAFSKKPEWKELGKVVVPAATPAFPGVGAVVGWHDLGDASFHFQTTKIGNGAAALLGQAGNVGVITATFCDAFGDPKDLPLAQRTLQGGDRGEVATGLGPVVTQRYAAVRRVFGVPHTTISLRYTSPEAPAPAQQAGQ